MNSKPRPFGERRGWPVVSALSVALGLATCLLVWFGARATIEWQRATRLFVASRVEQASDRITAALRHDLTQATALTMTRVSSQYDLTSVPHFAEIVGPALGKYTYVTVFFAWNAADDGMIVLGREHLDRPTWQAIEPLASPHPSPRLVHYARPPFASAITSRVRELSSDYPSQFGVFSLSVDGVTYQGVARLLYPHYARTYAGAIGFLVDLREATAAYLPAAAQRLARDMGEPGLTFAFFRAEDARNAPVDLPFARDRSFPLLFHDARSIDVLEARMTAPVETWVMRTNAADDALLAIANTGARRTFIVTAIAATGILVGLLLSIHALRRVARAAALESEFVSGVTHALKTPLTNIQLTAETLARGRFAGLDTVKDYAGILSTESARLTRLIDNLLGLAPVHGRVEHDDVSAADPAELVEEAVRLVRQRAEALGFRVEIDVPGALPPVSVDRRAILHAMDNVLDNAIKYSPTAGFVRIRASVSGAELVVEVSDEGIGIPPAERTRVFDTFYRGSNATADGSGLGLAIAARILRAHKGSIEVAPRAGQGTTIRMSLPLAL